MLAAQIALLRLTLRRSAFSIAGSVFLALGLGFLTSAAWIGLAMAQGPVLASLMLGLVYAGVGLILLAIASRRPRRMVAPPAALGPSRLAAPAGQASLIGAFLGGLETGRAIARRANGRSTP